MDMKVEIQQEHRWLERLVGDWTVEFEYEGKKLVSSETFRSLSGVWFVGEGQSTTPDGTPATTVMTLGYDARKKRYVGSWIGTMMSHFWVYDGVLDPGGQKLSLEADGPGFEDPTTTARYMDVIEFKGDDERTLTGHLKQPDGTWKAFMTATYRRKR